MIRIKRGLNVPICGSPDQKVEDGRKPRSIALLGYDYPGLKPTMEVTAGDHVVAGQTILTDKKNPGIKYTAPATGTVSAINRGARRVFQSLVIDVEEGDEKTFQSYDAGNISTLARQQVVDQLIDSGEWTLLRTRPFGKVPHINDVPAGIFVTAIDTRPLAPDPQIFIGENKDAFLAGLEVMARLTEGPVFVCHAGGANIPQSANTRVKSEAFSGPHPAGLVGTHIHFLMPVSQQRAVWHLGYQNLIAIGQLFLTGKLFHERIVSLAGPSVERPRLIRTRVGANTSELTAGEIEPGNQRVISGSVLDGRNASGAMAFIGRHHNQIAVLREGTDRELFGLVMPGKNKFSITNLYVSAFNRRRSFELTTSTGGSERAMVPIGSFEEVMPLDILPTQLLRSLLVGDIDNAIKLGCLELEEEDLALCTFVCSGKYEYGPYLRQMLTRIEEEG
ncbi:MAG TPA: Na(+)-translocating NADH-quinone reductase subunit A [Pseudomonadales bacterium]|nr:Na(+)-translocating NADH-quinone reductase subunit A [Pseudomonadales bacterium]